MRKIVFPQESNLQPLDYRSVIHHVNWYFQGYACWIYELTTQANMLLFAQRTIIKYFQISLLLKELQIYGVRIYLS